MTAAHFSICLPSFPDYTALFLLALLKTIAPLLDLHVNIPWPAPLYYLSLTSNIHHLTQVVTLYWLHRRHGPRLLLRYFLVAFPSTPLNAHPFLAGFRRKVPLRTPSSLPLMPTRVSLTATSLSSLFLPPSQPIAVCTPSILFQPHRALRALQGSSWVL